MKGTIMSIFRTQPEPVEARVVTVTDIQNINYYFESNSKPMIAKLNSDGDVTVLNTETNTGLILNEDRVETVLAKVDAWLKVQEDELFKSMF